MILLTARRHISAVLSELTFSCRDTGETVSTPKTAIRHVALFLQCVKPSSIRSLGMTGVSMSRILSSLPWTVIGAHLADDPRPA